MIKTTMVLIFCALAMAGCNGCGKLPGEVTHKYDNYLQDFNNDLMILGYKPIDFSETVVREADDMKESNSPIIGYCYQIAVKNGGPANISIDTKVSEYGADVKKVIIYHEIGHCFLGLNHTDNKKSIMTSQNLRTSLDFDDIFNDQKRLSLVKEMLNDSAYRGL